MTLGWIGLTPKYRELIGIFGTWSTSCDFCNCLLFALCVLDSVLQLSCVFLIVFCSCLVCFLYVCWTLCSWLTWPFSLTNPFGK
jgi:hypothetical protein